MSCGAPFYSRRSTASTAAIAPATPCHGSAARVHIAHTPARGRCMAAIMTVAGRLSRTDAERAARAGIDGLVPHSNTADDVIGAVRAVVDRKFGPPPRVLLTGLDLHATAFESVLESAGYVT